MNKVTLIGRLTKDPEVRQSAGEKPTMIANFTVACQRKFAKDGQASADFITCNAFGKQAEIIEKYFHKGNRIAVNGRITTGSYKDKSNNTVYTTNVTVEEIEFVESKADAEKSRESESTTAVAENVPAAPVATETPSFVAVPDSEIDDLPFA